MAETLQLQSLEGGWSWFEETCAQLGEPSNVLISELEHAYYWKIVIKDCHTTLVIRIAIEDPDDGLWKVWVDGVEEYPYVEWQNYEEPTNSDMLAILNLARLFELRRYVVREDSNEPG